jgi:SAM-dependent methyltransferase
LTLLWRLKLAIKVMAARLPLPYSFWQGLGLFRHGKMDISEYALKIFEIHARRAYETIDLSRRTILEIGPGDSLASAVIGRAYGAERVILVDAGSFARLDMAFYRRLAQTLEDRGLPSPDLARVGSIDEMLQACGTTYLTSGVDSLASLPDDSVDLIWSHSVLEHVYLEDVPRLFGEARRILRPGGLMSHNIDYQDHLAHSANSLRFSKRFWESDLIRKSGVYTNRLRASAMHRLVSEQGLEIMTEGFGRWAAPPVCRKRLHQDFRGLPDDDLLVRTSHLLARRPAGIAT